MKGFWKTSETFQNSFKTISETFKTSFRQVSETFRKHFRPISKIFQKHLRKCQYLRFWFHFNCKSTIISCCVVYYNFYSWSNFMGLYKAEFTIEMNEKWNDSVSLNLSEIVTKSFRNLMVVMVMYISRYRQHAEHCFQKMFMTISENVQLRFDSIPTFQQAYKLRLQFEF